MTTTIEQTPKEKLQAVMAELGLTVSSEFVPFSKSRNAKPGKDGKVWRSLNWKVTLRTKTHGPELPLEGRAILTTDYAAGEAHCPSYKQNARRTIDYVGALDYEIENGKKAGPSSFGFAGFGTKKIEPDAADVVAAFVMDASVLDCGSFEDWAGECGYDTDSREAEKTYRACLEIVLKLRNGIGEAGLAKLRDACQDY